MKNNPVIAITTWTHGQVIGLTRHQVVVGCGIVSSWNHRNPVNVPVFGVTTYLTAREWILKNVIPGQRRRSLLGMLKNEMGVWGVENFIRASTCGFMGFVNVLPDNVDIEFLQCLPIGD